MLGCMPPQRGISSYCLEISRNLSNKVNIEFISFKKMYPAFLYPKGGLEDDNTFPNVENEKLKVRRNLTYYNPISWFKESKVKGDIFHAQFWSFPLFYIYYFILLRYKSKGIKTIMTIHNVLPHESNFIFKMLSKKLYKIPDRLIVHSGSNKEELIKVFNINKDKIFVIPHGPLYFLNDKKISKKEARKKLAIDQKSKVILFFGAIREYKGLDVLLKAFAISVKKNKNLILLIAGKLWIDWGYYQKLIDKNNLNDKIIKILDYIPSNEVKNYFEACDLIVLPYKKFNAQSGVGAGALAFNKMVIASNISGLKDLKYYGAALFENNNEIDLAEKLNNNYKIHKNKKNLWKEIVEKTIEVYNK